MLKALLFDMGGTLEDVSHRPEFNENCGKKIHAYLEAQGLDPAMNPAGLMEHIEARYKAYRKWTLDQGREVSPFDLWSQWLLKGFTINQTRLRIVADNLAVLWERNYYRRSLRPEARPMLEALKQQGLALGIISNTPSYTQVHTILYEYGIRGYFDCIYLSVISGCRKPDAGLFLAAACDLGVLPGQCIYVGDTVSRDVRGPRTAGYRGCIRIHSDLAASSDEGCGTEGEEADYLVASLMEIPDLVKNIRNADHKEERE